MLEQIVSIVNLSKVPFAPGERNVSSPASDALAAAFADKKKALKAVYAVVEELEVVLRIEATPGMARLLKKIVLPKFRAAVDEYSAQIGGKMSANRILASCFGTQGNYGWNPNTDTVTVGLTA